MRIDRDRAPPNGASPAPENGDARPRRRGPTSSANDVAPKRRAASAGRRGPSGGLEERGERAAPDELAEPVQASGIRRAAERLWDSLDGLGLGRAAVSQTVGLARHPLSTAGAIGRYLNGTLVAAGVTAARALGGKPAGPMPVPARDRRFSDRTWEENALFFGLLQRHLLRERLMAELLEIARLEGPTAQKARLSSQLLLDALAPTNFLWTNPAALRRALETGGFSLLRGLRTWMDDLRLREGWPKLVDASGFEVGKTLAATPGTVVHRNAVMELIQYAPQTPEAFSVPLLCSPPCINKYYVMDLAPGRSFIEWAVKHGHTTFTISYRNPDASMRDVGLEDYLLQGPVEAMRVVREITGARKVNVAGLCLGGTLATMLAAHLEAAGDDSLNSLTLLNTLVDFGEPGPLGAFTDPRTLAGVLRRVDRRGYLDAAEMAHTFNLLRPNDLLFNYVSSGWLMGESPPAFDILAWNDDGTRIPARFLREYLRACYQQNALAREALVIQGRPLRPSRLRQDTFIVGAVEDHITPWKSAFKTTGLLGGSVRFVLSSAGHIAGIVNPPSKSASYWTQERLDASPEVWQAGASRHQGTWWEEWSRWIDARAGAREKCPTPDLDGSRRLMDAPGLYVHARA